MYWRKQYCAHNIGFASINRRFNPSLNDLSLMVSKTCCLLFWFLNHDKFCLNWKYFCHLPCYKANLSHTLYLWKKANANSIFQKCKMKQLEIFNSSFNEIFSCSYWNWVQNYYFLSLSSFYWNQKLIVWQHIWKSWTILKWVVHKRVIGFKSFSHMLV